MISKMGGLSKARRERERDIETTNNKGLVMKHKFIFIRAVVVVYATIFNIRVKNNQSPTRY